MIGKMFQRIILNQYPILENKGTITSKMAMDIAKKHYEKFVVHDDKSFQSDFDKMIEEIRKIEGENIQYMTSNLI